MKEITLLFLLSTIFFTHEFIIIVCIFTPLNFKYCLIDNLYRLLILSIKNILLVYNLLYI